MKKFALIAVALCVACVMAAPAGALEITTDGYYRAQYTGAWNAEMADKPGQRRQQLRPHAPARQQRHQGQRQPGHPHPLPRPEQHLGARRRRQGPTSTGNGPGCTPRSNFGILEVGRMQGGTWGTAFVDTEVDSRPCQVHRPGRTGHPVSPSTRKLPSCDNNFELLPTPTSTSSTAPASGRTKTWPPACSSAGSRARPLPTIRPPTPGHPGRYGSSGRQPLRLQLLGLPALLHRQVRPLRRSWRKAAWNVGKAVELVDSYSDATLKDADDEWLRLEPRRHLRLRHGLRPIRLRLRQRPGAQIRQTSRGHRPWATTGKNCTS